MAVTGPAPATEAERLAALHLVVSRAELDRRLAVRRLLPFVNLGSGLTVEPARVSRALLAWIGTGRLTVPNAGPIRLVPTASADRRVTLRGLIAAGVRHGIPAHAMRAAWESLPRDEHASITVAWPS